MKHWLAAFRLKTLPLALGAIILGSSLHELAFDFYIFLFAALTAIFLQVLSNLANDYGDFVKGTDRHRKDRQLSGGYISKEAMLVAIVVFVLLSLGSGIYLLHLAFADEWGYWFKFLGLGIASIIAAITYTVGKKAYGYNGLGDVFVFVFFGLIGVAGTAFLFEHSVESAMWLPAVAYGCMCVGVLNVNNIRDLDKDVLTNKITLASKLGRDGAIAYQITLLTLAFVGFVGHHLATGYYSLAPLALFILGYVHISRLHEAEHADDYNAQLKFLSLGSLAVVILFLIKLFV
ncbi:MAG: 1,4-dihydroxy-2-naphthoate octaprenyltransferase [Bacteroidetes bacterium]|mgnify:CR=1 FL=1|jgi:1,4-dihydroxy-2-naphthoate polyprenyltransferase|nr:1,4-dihydroxy-2-naphthoate octaprenyltransferase [Bacteroidota bacterium]